MKACSFDRGLSIGGLNPKLEYKIRNFTSKQKDYDKDKYRNENYPKN